MTTIENRFWNRINKQGPVPAHCPELGPCWIWTASLITGTGYGQYHPHRGATELAHRWAWKFSVGEIPDGLCVLHHCDVRNCVNPSHLFLGTKKDNSHDALVKGRLGPQQATIKRLWKEKWCFTHAGELQHLARLTNAAVREIRASYKPRVVTLAALAKKFGVAEQTIHDVVHGVSWKHV